MNTGIRNTLKLQNTSRRVPLEIGEKLDLQDMSQLMLPADCAEALGAATCPQMQMQALSVSMHTVLKTTYSLLK